MSWLIFAFLSAITAALVAIFGKIGLKNIDSALATTIRSLIMSGFLVLFSLLAGKFKNFSFNFTNKDWLFIVLAGISGALSWLFYFFALKIGLASKVVVIDRLSLVFVIILAAIFLSEPFGWRVVFGTILMIIGALLITLK